MAVRGGVHVMAEVGFGSADVMQLCKVEEKCVHRVLGWMSGISVLVLSRSGEVLGRLNRDGLKGKVQGGNLWGVKITGRSNDTLQQCQGIKVRSLMNLVKVSCARLF